MALLYTLFVVLGVLVLIATAIKYFFMNPQISKGKKGVGLGVTLLLIPALVAAYAIFSSTSEQSANNRRASSAQEGGDKYEELAKLRALLDSGAITKDEFEDQKRKLLAR